MIHKEIIVPKKAPNHDLSITRFAVLRLIYDHPGILSLEIARAMKDVVSINAVHQIVFALKGRAVS